MGYSNLEDLKAGRNARIESESSRVADRKAEDILHARTQELQSKEDRVNEIEAAEARGIQNGSRAGKMDAAKYFAERGFIPGDVFNGAAERFAQEDALADEADAGGLSIPPEMAGQALQQQANDIAAKLTQASAEGAPDDQINATLDALQVPDQIKQAAAVMFMKNKKLSGRPEMPQERMLPGSAVERMNSPVTRQAQQIGADTDMLIQKLHQTLQGPPQQGQQK